MFRSSDKLVIILVDTNVQINHKDKRGLIIDLLDKKNINAITYITLKKG